MYRVLVTGSRDWDDIETVKFSMVMAESGAHHSGAKGASEITLVSGACPTGADRIAEELAEELRWGKIERHPANWEKYGKRAGFLRNKEMVDSHPHICLAFIKNNSKGATMTADLAEKAGLRVVRYRA